jgi:hypothetical protein
MQYQSIQLRRDTAANWAASDPVLNQGEPGYEYDTGLLKIGDGLSHWTSLVYYGNLYAQSTTAVTVGTGNKTWLCATGLGFAPGQVVMVSYANDATIYMSGAITSYSAVTGYMAVNVTSSVGSGTLLTPWSIWIAQGPAGPAGPPNTLSIGAVTTLPEGSSATATISGASPTQTLNFGIPVGATGAQGIVTWPNAGIPVSTGSGWGTSLGTLFVKRTTLTSSGTFVTQATTNRIRLYMVGGGGGGGGCLVTSGICAAGGGGGGCAAEYMVNVSGSTSYSYTIGAGGSGGVGGNVGYVGGGTFMTIAGTVYSASAGLGGQSMIGGTTVLLDKGNLATCVAGNFYPTRGSTAMRISSTVGLSGSGGSSTSGIGGMSTGGLSTEISTNGNPGSGHGSGGSGAYSKTARTSYTGGTGTSGVIIIDEYSY